MKYPHILLYFPNCSMGTPSRAIICSIWAIIRSIQPFLLDDMCYLSNQIATSFWFSFSILLLGLLMDIPKITKTQGLLEKNLWLFWRNSLNNLDIFPTVLCTYHHHVTNAASFILPPCEASHSPWPSIHSSKRFSTSVNGIAVSCQTL